jgi:hypothetical protein
MSTQDNKPIDRWLGILGTVMGIILFLSPKNPVVIVGCLVAIFALLIHPLWNFWWIEKKLKRRIITFTSLIILLIGYGYYVWPSSEVEKTSPSTGVRLILQSPMSAITNTFKICKNNSWENFGIRFSIVDIKNKHYYKNFTERIMAFVGKDHSDIKPVIYGTISTIKGDKLKKFSSVEAHTCMYLDNLSIKVISISIDSECAEFIVAQNKMLCQ